MLDEQAAQFLGAEDDNIFGEITQDNYHKRWKRFCEINGIDYVTPYELRHTFVSVAKNMAEGRVKALVGHSYNMDTFGVYGHEMQGEQLQTAQELEGLFDAFIRPKCKTPSHSSVYTGKCGKKCGTSK